MLASLFRVLVLLAVVYVVVAALAWKYQDRMAFPAPKYAELPPPAAARIPDGRLVSVTTEDSVELRGWYLPPNPAPRRGGRAPGLIWFYGNMETIRAVGPIIRDFRPAGTALLVLDYRGYGASGGTPTETGVYLDAEAAWDLLARQPEVDSGRIAVYGRSVGSVPALYLAAGRPVRAVILDSPFTSARDMQQRHYAWLPSFITRLSLDNLSRARSLSVPLLVVHGTDDRIAPFVMGHAVAEAGRGELVRIEGAGHNDTYDMGGTLYRQAVHAFLAEYLREEGRGKREE
jgi:fermentation-respiration switch protein FrsA (DUF1100 family)